MAGNHSHRQRCQNHRLQTPLFGLGTLVWFCASSRSSEGRTTAETRSGSSSSGPGPSQDKPVGQGHYLDSILVGWNSVDGHLLIGGQITDISKGRSVDVFGIHDYDGAMLVHHGLVIFIPVGMFRVSGDSIHIT